MTAETADPLPVAAMVADANRVLAWADRGTTIPDAHAADLACHTLALAAECDRLAAEREAILRWSIRHAGRIGATDDGQFWAKGDGGMVFAPTAEAAVRLAAGLEANEGGGE